MGFAGFRKPEKEYYPTPNEWTDITADIDSLAELKVIEYVMRHTWGFREQRNGKWIIDYRKAVKISIDEFMHGRKRKDNTRMDRGTGLSKQSVLTGIEKALEHGYIEYGEETEKAKSKRSYRLRLVKDLDQSEDQLVKNLDQQLVQEVDQRGQRFRPDHARNKETSETQLTKDTFIPVSGRKGKGDKVTWYIKRDMKGCLIALNGGVEDKAYLERAQQMYIDSGIEDSLLFKQKIDQAIQNTQIYAWNRSNEEKMEYFFKYLAKALGLQQERIAQ